MKFNKGDKVVLESGESGEFVRFYGQKVQIKTKTGRVTGVPAKNGEKPKGEQPLGTVQEAILKAIKKNPEISYRELGVAAGVPTHRAATCMKSLIERGKVTKEVGEGGGKNTYEVVENEEE